MTNIQQILHKLEEIDLKDDKAINQINDVVSNELRNLSIIVDYINVGEYLVRSRPLMTNEEFHYSISDFSYNPNPDIIKIGRTNFPGHQIFYGSRFRITSLAETRFIYANKESKDAKYSLGRWDLREDLTLACIIDPLMIKKYSAMELNRFGDYFEELSEGSAHDLEINKYFEIYRYMAAKFIEPVFEGEEYKYKITAVFSNFVFSKLPFVDGILYQSVQYPKNYNVALKREVIDQRKIQLTAAWRQKFSHQERLNYKEIESIQAKSINYNSGVINW